MWIVKMYTEKYEYIIRCFDDQINAIDYCRNANSDLCEYRRSNIVDGRSFFRFCDDSSFFFVNYSDGLGD